MDDTLLQLLRYIYQRDLDLQAAHAEIEALKAKLAALEAQHTKDKDHNG